MTLLKANGERREVEEDFTVSGISIRLAIDRANPGIPDQLT